MNILYSIYLIPICKRKSFLRHIAKGVTPESPGGHDNVVRTAGEETFFPNKGKSNEKICCKKVRHSLFFFIMMPLNQNATDDLSPTSHLSHTH